MADESHYSSATDSAIPTGSNKRKFDDGAAAPPSSTRRPTGFSSPDSAPPPPPSYNSVPPPVDDFQIAKQRAQEIAARLLSGAPAGVGGAGGGGGAAATEIKRPRVDNGGNGFDSVEKGFSSAPPPPPNDGKPMASAIPVAYGSKKINIPNGRVGVIIGKGGETIKYLQIQSGAKIQVTRDMDADPNSPNRPVELMGSPEAIAKAEKLIYDVLAEAEVGGSGTVSRRFSGQGGGNFGGQGGAYSGQGGVGGEKFIMKIPNNKVGLVIGKGGETIKNMQASTGARIQVVPLHLPPNDASIERNVHMEGTSEQIEAAKRFVNEVISSENRGRNPSMGGGYPQQGYQARPPSSWGPPPPMQQPGYNYMQAGGYPGPSPQYNMSQPPYPGYPQPTSGGYPTNWDQSNAPANQQTSQGYDYYSQPPSSQQQAAPGGSAAPTDNTGYNYSQPAAPGYGQQGQGYTQDGYGGYAQSGYGQPAAYDQQQGYASAPSYGNVPNANQEGHTPYGSQGDSGQAPPQPPAMGQQGYSTGQQPSPSPSYPPQGSNQSGYGLPPSSQTGYGSQPATQPGYGSSYGAPQTQKPPANPPAFGQSQQSPGTAVGYGQSVYQHSQTPPSGYAQPDSGSQRAPPAGYGSTTQPGYGPPYGVPPVGQPGYGQGMPHYGTYGSGYPQPAAYPADGNGSNNARASYDAAPASQPVQSGASKTSPES